MIYHIYWGTAGNAGLYMDEIFQTLKKAGYNQKVFVSYYYPFDYGEKVFFKRTEMEHCKYIGVKRSIMQALELLLALIKILLAARKDKPQIVNYSYVSTGNVLILAFLKMLKRVSRCKLVITCHDVVPFTINDADYKKEMSIKSKIYALADGYIIHNKNSRQDLLRLFDISETKIYEHPFPIMDLSKIDKGQEEFGEKFDFLFIGHLRKAKGVEFLLEAWKEFHKINPTATLCIAGNPTTYKQYFEEHEDECRNNNIILKLGFVKDNDYIRLVKSSHCVLFPYNAGTNSGVISTVISLNRLVITSDIEMFANNSLIPTDGFYKCGDMEGFVNLLGVFYKIDSIDYSNSVHSYRIIFDNAVNKVYKQLM